MNTCTLFHYKLCWAFIWDGHGPEGCTKSDDECNYKHPHICENSWNRRYCPNLRNCPYRHLSRTTESPRGIRRVRFTESSDSSTPYRDQIRGQPAENLNRNVQRYTNNSRSYASVTGNSRERRNGETVNRQRNTEIETHPHAGSNDMRTFPPQERRGERPDYIPSTVPHHQDVASTFLSHEQFREYQEASRLELSDLKQTLMRIQETLTQTQRAPIVVPYQAPQQGFNRPMNLVYGM